MVDHQQLPDVWVSRDLPVLVEITRRKDEGEDFVQVSHVATALGIAEGQVLRAGAALKRRGLITASGSMAAEVETFDEVSGEAYFLTGLHPSGDDAVSALVAALRQAADHVEDPDEKGRLRSLADAALGISRDVMGGVLTAVLTAGVTS